MSSPRHASAIQNSTCRSQKGTGAAIAVALLLICSAVAPLGAQAPESLFAEVPPGLAGPAVADSRPFFVRSRTVSLNAGVLDRAIASPATSAFTLNLFDDAVFALAVERIENSRFGHRTWAGHIVDRPLSTVTLTQKDDIVTGLVTDGTTAYEVVALGGGVHRIDQLDTTQMPRERDVFLRPSAVEAADALAGPAVSSPAAVSTADIFVYYSAVLRMQVGLNVVQSRIAQYIADANLAYQRSGVNGQLQLVGTAEIDAPDPGDPVALLDGLSSSTVVLNQRETFHADLVALLVSEMTSSDPNFITCGIGHIGPGSNAAFSVTTSQSGCVYTFAHEIGHNLGGQHAQEDGVLTGPDLPTYARGYKAPDHSFRTVMAYDCQTGSSCPRILNFSNPGVSVDPAGSSPLQPTGTESQRNADRLNVLFPSVAAYRSGSATQAPSAPLGLQAFVNGSNVTLQWQASVFGAPTNYVVVAGTGPGLSNLGEVPVGVLTTVSAPLPAGVYYARVYAQNAAGTSSPSNEVSIAVGAASAPGSPSGLVFNVAGSTVSLSFQPPTTGGAPTVYLVDAGTGPGLSNLVFEQPIPGTSLVVPGVAAGRYFIRVRARNAVGTSAPSNEIDVSVASCSPSAPQNFTVTKNGFIVTASWLAPAVGAPSTYIVQAGSAPGLANLFNGSVGLTTSLSAQAPPGTYFLRVLAASACGTGPASGDVAITVP